MSSATGLQTQLDPLEHQNTRHPGHIPGRSARDGKDEMERGAEHPTGPTDFVRTRTDAEIASSEKRDGAASCAEGSSCLGGSGPLVAANSEKINHKSKRDPILIERKCSSEAKTCYATTERPCDTAHLGAAGRWLCPRRSTSAEMCRRRRAPRAVGQMVCAPPELRMPRRVPDSPT